MLDIKSDYIYELISKQIGMINESFDLTYRLGIRINIKGLFVMLGDGYFYHEPRKSCCCDMFSHTNLDINQSTFSNSGGTFILNKIKKNLDIKNGIDNIIDYIEHVILCHLSSKSTNPLTIKPILNITQTTEIHATKDIDVSTYDKTTLKNIKYKLKVRGKNPIVSKCWGKRVISAYSSDCDDSDCDCNDNIHKKKYHNPDDPIGDELYVLWNKNLEDGGFDLEAYKNTMHIIYSDYYKINELVMKKQKEIIDSGGKILKPFQQIKDELVQLKSKIGMFIIEHKLIFVESKTFDKINDAYEYYMSII